MGRHVDRKFIIFLIKGYYKDRKNHQYLCCYFKCKRLANILHEIDQWSFCDLNKGHNKWFLILHNKFDPKVTLFPVFI